MERKKKLNRQDLIELVIEIMKADCSEEEHHEKILLLENNLIDPKLTDYIYYDDLTAEEVVDKALKFKPIILDMPTDKDPKSGVPPY